MTAVTQLRDEYDNQFAALCAAFDRSYSSDRREAMRASFVGKLTAAQVARMVERLVGEHGPERMPTVREMWTAYRALRAPRPTPPAAPPGAELSRWNAAANTALFFAAIAHPGRDSAAGWDLARRLGQQFQALADDGDPAATFDTLKAAVLREYATLPPDPREPRTILGMSRL